MDHKRLSRFENKVSHKAYYFVHVKYLSATNHRGSRYKVWDSFGNVKTYQLDYSTSKVEPYALQFVEDFKDKFKFLKNIENATCQYMEFYDKDLRVKNEGIVLFFI